MRYLALVYLSQGTCHRRGLGFAPGAWLTRCRCLCAYLRSGCLRNGFDWLHEASSARVWPRFVAGAWDRPVHPVWFAFRGLQAPLLCSLFVCHAHLLTRPAYAYNVPGGLNEHVAPQVPPTL
jgi:hypothetical protein